VAWRRHSGKFDAADWWLEEHGFDHGEADLSGSWQAICRLACPAALAKPSIYAAKRLCWGPSEERRVPTKTILH
jgi:hypothetical protein